MILFVEVAIMMALSSLGVEIAPLIVGAGVVGVAIGFGAQTVVKDIISGMFYLLDDAFRVGEYIQSGRYKGTVESFSLRSVKLRHHRKNFGAVNLHASEVYHQSLSRILSTPISGGFGTYPLGRSGSDQANSRGAVG